MSRRKLELQPSTMLPSAVADAIVPRLDRVSLPEEYVALLATPLTELQWDQREDQIDRVEFGEKASFRYTLVFKGDLRRALLHLSDEIITAFTRANQLALMELREAFYPNYRTFYVFHDSQPNGIYRNLMVGHWATLGIETKFIATSNLRDFQQQPLESQTFFLKRELDLEPPGAKARQMVPVQEKVPVQEMPTASMMAFMGIVANLPDFNTANKRRVIVESAGLARHLPEINLEGAPLTVASDLILLLIRNGGIGDFLTFLRGVPDLPADDQKLLTHLTERYDFG